MRTERVIAIENPCRLSIDTSRLKIDREGTTTFIATTDIAVLLIDTVQVEMTAGVIRELAQSDVAIIVTDARHYPSALLAPIGSHTHTARRQKLQAVLPQPFADEMWAITIRAKLRNQAKFLSAQGATSPLARLERMAASIQPVIQKILKHRVQSYIGKTFLKKASSAPSKMHLTHETPHSILDMQFCEVYSQDT